MRRSALASLCLAPLVALGAASCCDDRPAGGAIPQIDADPHERYRVGIPDGAPSRGPVPALVTIVTFSDFEAPRAARNAECLAELVRRFPGEVGVVYRANPLPRHQDAERAELAARAAQRLGRFWEMHDALFAGAGLGEADILAAASKAGIDPEALRRLMEDPALTEPVALDRQAALDLGLADAPVNFANGRLIDPIRYVDDAAAILREEIARAGALLASGIAADRLYERIVGDGKTRIPGATRARRRVRDPDAVYAVQISPDDPVRGPDDAPLTIVELADFECPFSARLHRALGRLAKALPGRIRLAFKHHPLPSHPNAAMAAEAAVEAEAQGEFWEFCDLLFASEEPLSRERLLELATTAGLDRGALEQSLDDRRHAARVERDRALARTLDLRGTPHLFLNGEMVRGSRSFDQLLALAEPAIRRAERLAEDGGAGDLYERIVAGGATAPVYLPPGSGPVDPDLVTDGAHRVYGVEVPKDAPVLGPEDAPATVVEFGDYQCGWCARLHGELVDLVEERGGEARLAIRHFPVSGHEHAALAAEAAVEAEAQGRFWPFHERLLAHQDELSEEDLAAHAAAAGLDAERMRDALAKREHRERVRRDVRDARRLGLAGTPSFFVNGRKVSGPPYAEGIAELVDRVLGRSRDPAALPRTGGRVDTGRPYR